MSPKSRLLIDVGAFLALLVAYNPSWSGLAVHEWLSLAVAVPLLLHLTINWEWTRHATKGLLEKLRLSSRWNLVVDAGLFFATVTVMLSGLMVSRVILAALGSLSEPSAIWIAVHSVSADWTIALLLAHFALHWSWLARALGVQQRGSRTERVRPAR